MILVCRTIKKLFRENLIKTKNKKTRRDTQELYYYVVRVFAARINEILLIKSILIIRFHYDYLSFLTFLW